ncbi:hypothetical protein [Yersinia enterocolitica]|uniref:hypothetical protein n=1 Tax=Yersinia enterocolitica TaxID=630 RepID=UPI0021E74986|nr:hypothetical protein [Yersinia enterocolitica]EKN4861460.1 hypothetical protein [Yersinia enterocolitica]EKN6238868.1 hypothetical protein [Yersinia enterocolitica]MDA5532327.1 hypothetical protein [Yersinia enterocolitica]UYK07478.1 hypothetical protein N4218_06620 [Yersinia enterocolitica]HEI6940081.1 hypothetical protein [Yersinia enterocolitica]
MQNRFYMACLRDTVGRNMAFHCYRGCGYATDIGKAHIYTLEEAQKSWNLGRDIDLPVSADAIDAAAVWHVDHQLIPSKNTIETDCAGYVAFIKDKWNRNDVYWLSDLMPTDDFNKAKVFPEPDVTESSLVWLPFVTADAVKRRTFNIDQLNRRTMIQAAGLRVPDWLKRQTRRKSSGKTRWNCPHCGKISWQYNPYDFDGCADWACKGSHR